MCLVVRTLRCALVIEVTLWKLNSHVYFLTKSLHNAVLTHKISVLIKHKSDSRKESCNVYSKTWNEKMCLVLHSDFIDLYKLYCIVNVRVDEWNRRHDVANSAWGEGGLAASITNFDL